MPHQAGRIVTTDSRPWLCTVGGPAHFDHARAYRSRGAAPLRSNGSPGLRWHCIRRTHRWSRRPTSRFHVDATAAARRRGADCCANSAFSCRLRLLRRTSCLADGQSLREFGIDVWVIHTPGHTAGSVTIAFDDGTCFVGDAILNLLRGPRSRSCGKMLTPRGASACRIRALRPRVLYMWARARL